MKKILGTEVPYINTICALLYSAQCIRVDIAFSMNVLARFSSAPTQRHWNEIKHLLFFLLPSWNKIFRVILYKI